MTTGLKLFNVFNDNYQILIVQWIFICNAAHSLSQSGAPHVFGSHLSTNEQQIEGFLLPYIITTSFFSQK